MKGSDLVRDWQERFPPYDKSGVENQGFVVGMQEAIFEAAAAGYLGGPWADFHAGTMPWVELPTTFNGHTGIVRTSELPLCLGDRDDFVMVPVSARTSQRLADLLGLQQPTTKLMDLARQAPGAAVIRPPTQYAAHEDRLKYGYSPSMSDALASARFTKEVLARIPKGKFGAFPYKAWPLTNATTSPAAAHNYGLYDEGAPYLSASGLRLWQQLAGKHTPEHADYSQVFVVFHPEMTCDGHKELVLNVARDPDLCGLVSSEGVLLVTRQMLGPAASGVVPTRPLQPAPGILTITRTLRLGARGQDVADWQAFLRATPDGTFGPQTDAATRQFQSSAGLTVDGVVGPKTVAAANATLAQRALTNSALTTPSSPPPSRPQPVAPPAPQPAPAPPKPAPAALTGKGSPMPGDALAPPLVPPPGLIIPKPLVAGFRQARQYTAQDRSSSIRHVVIHTAEVDELPTMAGSLVATFASPSYTRQASFHYAVDSRSIWQGVKDEHIAWHAPGANQSGIGIELCARARQTAADWADDYSRAELELAAQLVAGLCRRWSIPPTWVGPEGLRAGDRGVTTHLAVTEAFRKSDHTDPGPNFPMAAFLGRVAQILG